MRIENEADAKGVVRKYINGTRSRHGKIASIVMDEESKGPDDLFQEELRRFPI